MRLSVRVFLGFFLVVGLCAYFLMNTFVQEVKPGVRQGMEVALVDTANLLAELATPELKAGRLSEGEFVRAIEAYQTRELKARVWGLDKRAASFRVYLTDARGQLLFDSAGDPPGTDYSRWNDVQRTLRGEYGARSTRGDTKVESSSAMHVAAPLRDGERIIGVLTVVTPTSSVLPYAQRSQRKVLQAGLALMGVALLVGVGISWWLTRSIDRLRHYARSVADGRQVEVPSVGGGELAELGRALETMRDKLENRAYVERYVHTLTHEMKSPLAAIRGAGELLEEAMAEGDRRRFILNIREQEERVRLLLDRMLQLAAVEQRKGLQDPSRVSVKAWVDGCLANKEIALRCKGLQVTLIIPSEAHVFGETFLLEQALSNLLDNAVAFAPEGSTLSIAVEAEGPAWVLRIQDQGPGLPDFALAKVFEPFFSLARPDTSKKSTGLGLSFVQGVALLHGGSVTLLNHPSGGAEARLYLAQA